MKNIHILPTDKPSRLACDFDKLILNSRLLSPILYKTQHIYITSDEEIKEGDWCIGVTGKLIKVSKKSFDLIKDLKVKPNWKKIILTTDQSLDAVQTINDEFLEWFVKNPSCEEVEVAIMNKGYDSASDFPYQEFYKIIIPNEEPKITNCGNKNCQSGVINGKNPKLCKKCNPTEEPKQELERGITITHVGKQETLEEAAERLAKDAYKKHSVKDDKLSLDEQIQRSGGFIVGFKEGMIEGAKWNQERSYSEEDMFEFSQWISHEDWVYLPSKGYWVNEEQEELEQKLNSKEILNMWFEQFKKK